MLGGDNIGRGKQVEMGGGGRQLVYASGCDRMNNSALRDHVQNDRPSSFLFFFFNKIVEMTAADCEFSHLGRESKYRIRNTHKHTHRGRLAVIGWWVVQRLTASFSSQVVKNSGIPQGLFFLSFLFCLLELNLSVPTLPLPPCFC